MDKEEIKHAYDDLYNPDFFKVIADTFEVLAEGGYDLFKAADVLLGSQVIACILEKQSYKFLNYGYRQMLESISYDEHFEYKETVAEEDYDPDIAFWSGYVLGVFFWKYSIDFSDWLKYFSTEDVYKMYYPAHEASYDWSADLLYRNYTYAKEHNMIRDRRE